LGNGQLRGPEIIVACVQQRVGEIVARLNRERQSPIYAVAEVDAYDDFTVFIAHSINGLREKRVPCGVLNHVRGNDYMTFEGYILRNSEMDVMLTIFVRAIYRNVLKHLSLER
jgi:hypothetical protein